MASDIQKTYLYKVYKAGVFLGVLQNVSSDFVYSQDMMSSFVTINVEVDVSADVSELPVSPLQDEAGNNLLDEAGNILYEEHAPDVLGSYNPNALVQENNQLKVYEYSTNNLNGKLVFDGYIEAWAGNWGGNDEKITFMANSKGVDLVDYIAHAASADTGQKLPTAYDVTGTSFTNPTNAFAQDGSYATNNSFGGNATYKNFVFGIPSGSTITGIEVTIRGKVSSHDNPNELNVSIKGAAGTTFQKTSDHATSGTWGTSDSDIVFGGAGDLWGAGWTTADFADGTFFITLYDGGFTGRTISIDSVKIRIYYTPSTTTAAFSGLDPSTGILAAVMTDYASQGGLVTYSAGVSIVATGNSASYTFILATPLEVIKKCLELSPSTYYWYVDPATNILYFKNTATTATHRFIKGRHINQLQLQATVEQVRNVVYFSGGATGGVNLLSAYTNSASILTQGRRRLERLSDNRVTIQATADLIANNFLAEHADKVYSSPITILAENYDISTINVGDTVGVRGFGNFPDTLVLQVARLTRRPDSIDLVLGVLLQRQSDALAAALQDLNDLQTVANPSTPS